MADGVSIESARAEMAIIGKRLEDAYPLTNKGIVPQVQSFREFFIFENEDAFYVAMLGAVGFVLLIACANLANLVLARAMARSREMSVRIALGAGRWRIIRQLLVESLMLSGLGALFGWWIANWAVRAYALADRGPGRSSWRILDYSMNHQVVGYFIVISIGTAFLFGLAPALRLSKLDVNTTLREGGRGAVSGRRRTHVSDALVTAEVALAVVLLAAAGVMSRSFLNVYTADLGVSTSNVLTVSVDLPSMTYASAARWISFFEDLQIRLEALPGVESVAIADRLPANGARRLPYELAHEPSADGQRPMLAVLTVGPRYFATLAARGESG
jgi:predicted permease